MNARSKLCLKFVLQQLPGTSRVFWTFTTWSAQDVRIASRQWSLVARRLVHLKYRFVRVYEMHETHGLHVHVVGAGRLPIEMAYAATRGTIFGHVDVRAVESDGGLHSYLTSYITKARREPAFRGIRVWAACGWGKGERDTCADIAFETPEVLALRARGESITMESLHWERLRQLDLSRSLPLTQM
jgi:hypothetical protein